MSIPMVSPRQLLQRSGRKIIRDLFRFLRQGHIDQKNGILASMTIAEYLESRKYSTWFRDGFIYPAFAAICTCTLEAIRSYPADLIIRYLNDGLLFQSVRRVTHGIKDVVARFSQPVQRLKLSTRQARWLRSGFWTELWW